MNILYVGNSRIATGVTYYRMIVPGRALENLGHKIRVSSDLAVRKPDGTLAIIVDDLEWADTIVFPRFFPDASPNILVALVEFCKKNGKKVIWETDDFLDKLPEHNPVSTQTNIESTQKSIEFLRKSADGKTVSTRILQEHYGGKICPNSVDMELWGNLKKEDAGKLVIGWSGGWTHQKDLEMIIPVLQKLKKKHKFEIRLFGFDPEFNKNTLYYKFYNHVNVFKFPQRFAELGFDIAIAPLIDDEFNQYKSNIKWLEASMLGIPTVASNLPPYEDIKDGETGFLCANIDEWSEKLEKLILSKTLRTKLGKQAKEYVIGNYDIKRTVINWEKAYAC
jgi:glycosyltransferase involved in cell wall biosynthesis